MFGVFRTHALTLTGSREVGGGVHALDFHANSKLTWIPGQHALIRLPGWSIKPFTIASAPQEGVVVIGTSLASGSAYKRQLAGLRAGDRVTLHGPLMDFTVGSGDANAVMLAQGVGITPFRAMLRGLSLDENVSPRTTLVHVANEHAFQSDTEADATSAFYPRHAADFTAIVDSVTREQPHAAYFIAGHRRFVASTASLLTAAGIRRAQIRRDTYLGYTPRETSA